MMTNQELHDLSTKMGEDVFDLLIRKYPSAQMEVIIIALIGILAALAISGSMKVEAIKDALDAAWKDIDPT